MSERPNCKNCEEALVKIKHGYHCPNCHSLYTKELTMVWDGTRMKASKERNEQKSL